MGLRCIGAEKGPGSVDYSMKWLQSLKAIIIDPKRCPDTWDEFSSYEYEHNKDGEIISGYPDYNNHHIDAVRYGTENIWRRPGAKGIKTAHISPFLR
jgi:phage terminase large subunit